MKRRCRKILNIFLTISLACVVLFSGTVGCFDDCLSNLGLDGSSNYEFCFNNKQVELVEGEEWYVNYKTDLDFTPSRPLGFKFDLSSSDESVIEIFEDPMRKQRVIAVATGTATLTLTDTSGKSATCIVTVTKEVESVEVATRTRSRLISENREIEVYALVNGRMTSRAVIWEIDGVTVNGYNGSSYLLPPSEVEKTVKVKATVSNSKGENYSDTLAVNWHNGFTTLPTLSLKSGTTQQIEGSVSSVTYEVNHNLSVAPVIEWFVNGEKQLCEERSFVFTPSDEAGKSVVTATVNGVDAISNDNEVFVVGSRVPTGVEVDFDTFYPSVFVSWDNANEDETFSVKVTSYENQNSTTYSASGTSLMLSSEQINLFKSAYKVEVASLGNGKELTPSDYSEAVSVKKLTATEKIYLDTNWFGGNYYITSDEEFCDIFDRFMLYRTQPQNDSSTETYRIYLGYESEYTLNRLSTIAFNRASYTGSYDINVSESGKVATIKIGFYTISSPTIEGSKPSSESLNGLKPHISETGREENAKLFVDTLEKEVTVVTTDQLYRALEEGYKPKITNDETAEYYEYARAVLKSIIDDGMNDEEKAHAIYDWVMWRVMYDDDVTSIMSISEAVKHDPFYLEGVLTDENYYAVCDGMSKAYSLLCNMEGIPCMRVVGMATGEGVSGGHAWNKVQVDGEWFIVDCTWGDVRISVKEKVSSGFLGAQTKTVSSELASHKYFLLTDEELPSHQESEDTVYPKTSAIPYNFNAELTYEVGEAEIRTYLYSTDGLTNYAKQVANLAQAEIGSGTREYYVNGTLTISNTFAFEIYLAPQAQASVSALIGKSTASNPIVTALSAKGMKVNVFNDENLIIVVASKQRNLVS